MPQPLHLIVNPASGGGRAGRRLPRVIEMLHERNADFRTTFSRSLEHAGEVAAKAAATGEIAVAMGGDGLVNAVVGAVAAEGAHATAGVVPAGRGNDFARALGVRNVDQAVDVVAGGRTRKVDLGAVDGRVFCCIASFGLDSDVIEAAEHARIAPGATVYPYATVKALARWRPARFHIEIDGTEHDFEGYNVVVANSAAYGGGMRVAPGAEIDDGVFDVVAIGSLTRAGFLMQAPRVFWGGHVGHRAVNVWRGTKVRLAADREFTVYADGEPFAPAPVSVEVLPGALTVLAP